MRDVFSEYYLPDDDEEVDFLQNAVVVVDTNVLLSLYRMTTHEREQQLDALAKVADRLWIPYQVGWEFQRNRMRVIKERAGRYNTLEGIPSAGTADAMRSEIRGLNLPDDVTAEVEALLDPLAAKLDEIVAPFIDRARELAARHVIDPTTALRSDPVRDRLDDLFEGRVGPRPDDTVRSSRIAEARERTARKEPPGYKDQGKGDDVAKAGDYLLWAELLDHAGANADTAQPFLFVTGDEKEDWFMRDGFGRPTGPRTELIVEFAAANPHGYHQITHARFLTLAQQHLGVTVDADTIARADSIAKEAASPTVDMAWPGSSTSSDVAVWLEARARSQRGSDSAGRWWTTTGADHHGAARKWAAKTNTEFRLDRESPLLAPNDRQRGEALKGSISDFLNPAEATAIQGMKRVLDRVEGAHALVSEAYLMTAIREHLADSEQQPVEGRPEVSAAFVEALAVAVSFVSSQDAGAFVRAQVEKTHPNLTESEKRLLTGIVLLRSSVSGRPDSDTRGPHPTHDGAT